MRQYLLNKKVRCAPYDQTREYDSYLSEFVRQIRDKTLKENNDDYLLVIAGPTGTGKSNIGLHIYEEFDPKGCDIKYVAQKRDKFADALKAAKDKKGLRFVDYDEANVNKRDSLTQWNKDIMNVYFTIRGLNIFHVWNNPSVDMLDKAFIEERVKGLILVYDKSPLRRIYYFFKMPTLLKIYEKHGNLKLRTLIKNRNFAFYKGWFREYKGKLREPYLAQKSQSMSDTVDAFHEKWGSKAAEEAQNWITRAKLAKQLSVSVATLSRYEKEMEREGILMEGINMKSLPTGYRTYSVGMYEAFLDKMSMKSMKVQATQIKPKTLRLAPSSVLNGD